MSMKEQKTKTKTKTEVIDEEYEVKGEIEHILDLPDTFIGSIKLETRPNWIINDKDEFEFKEIEINPGLYKIFDEVIVNALDQEVRMRESPDPLHRVSEISVHIDREIGAIVVRNNGKGIAIEKHKQLTDKYNPEIIFGMLRSSSNYKKNQKRIVGGKNGYGVKLCNIFSKEFIVETTDVGIQKKYKQVWRDNMGTCEKPKISKHSGKPFTQITYLPDYERFHMKGMTDDVYALLRKRVYDVSALTPMDVRVSFNGTLIKIKQFDKYADMFIGTKRSTKRVNEVIMENLWEVVVCQSPDNKFEQVSYVNGICTSDGGEHVDYMAKLISRKLQKWASEKGVGRKKVKIKQEIIQDNLFIMLRATVQNPSFTSQTKVKMTTPYKEFGYEINVSDDFIAKVVKLGVLEQALRLSEFKEGNVLDKVGGKMVQTLHIPKLDDANWAGRKGKSKECTLILTEGDSAKALAVAGLSVIGRDKFGVYPLRGKVTNVRDMAEKRVAESQIIDTLVKIMGLQFKLKYETEQEFETLRYGRIMIFTDQDLDGFHIKGLIMNFISFFWKALAQREGFISSLPTKIVEATRSRKKKTEKIPFYTLQDYDKWIEATPDANTYSIKYYKGLATSTSAEAKDYFNSYDKNLIKYHLKDKEDNDAIDLAFNKKRADDRKKLIMNLDPKKVLDVANKNVKIKDFVNEELAHFSNYDCVRSIPNMVDGLKISQRKVLYTCLERNLTKDIKVAQLSGAVSEKTQYHHGEVSLQGTIVNMAQNFVGSNNINLLYPSGQFGTRAEGGKDSGAPRYIYTRLMEYTKSIYHPDDANLLTYCEDDGIKIEPEYFIPIIPMILVNGHVGIGTGYSCTIPCYNPDNIIRNIKLLIDGKTIEKMKPFYRGFKGQIKFNKKLNRWDTYGIFHREKLDIIKITELPIGTWTDRYEEFLIALKEGKAKTKTKTKAKKSKDSDSIGSLGTTDSASTGGATSGRIIKSFTKNHPENGVEFTIKFMPNVIDTLDDDLLIDMMKLQTSFKNTNMHLYDENLKIKKYETVEEILEEFYTIRLRYYEKRLKYLIDELTKSTRLISAKAKFVLAFVNDEIELRNRSDEDINEQLEKLEIPTIEESYDYLLRMPIRSLTKQKVKELKKQLGELEQELEDLKKKSAKDLYIHDLKILQAKLLI